MRVPVRGMRWVRSESRGHHTRQILPRSPLLSGRGPRGTDRVNGSVGRRCVAVAGCSSDIE